MAHIGRQGPPYRLPVQSSSDFGMLGGVSAHFAVLKDADLVHAEKVGRSVIYHLKLSVLEEALLGFVQSFGAEAPKPKKETSK